MNMPFFKSIDKWFLLFHFEFLLSALFLLSRPLILGIDSYAFFLLSCDKLNFSVALLPRILFTILPCNQLVFNLVAIICFYIFTVILGKIIELYYPDKKWKIMCLMWLVPTICNFFYQFENSSIGMISTTLFLLIYLKAKKAGVKNFHLLVLLLIPIGLFVWNWSLVVLFALMFENLIGFGLFLLVSLFLGFNTVFGSLLPLFDSNNNILAENQPGIAVFAFFMILIGMFNFKKDFRRIASVFVFLGLIAAKFMYFALPFLMMGAFEFFYRFEFRWEQWRYINYRLFKNVLVFLIFFFIVPYMLFTTIYHAVPSIDDFEMINKGIKISKDVNLPLKNEWGLGYWILYLGQDTNRFGGWTPNDDDFNQSIAITTYRKLDCGLIEQGKTLMQIRLYYCP